MDILDITYLIIFFLFGSIFGSFSNVLIERLPIGLSIVRPASHCMKCNHPLKWYDNIPILSFIILKGKCRYCHEKYSPRYFIVEIVNGVMYSLIYLRYDLSASAIIFSLLFTMFGAIFFIDLKHLIIPDSLNISVFVLSIFSLIFNKYYINVSLLDRGISLGFSLILILVVLLLYKITKKEYLGFGDVKLILCVGLLIGFKLQILGLFFGAFVALIVEVIIKRKRKNLIPFGPYLCIGYLIAIGVGEILINWYMSLF